MLQALKRSSSSSSSSSKRPPSPSAMVINLNVHLLCLPVAQGLNIPILISSFMPPDIPCPETPPIVLSPTPFRFSWMNVLAGYVMRELYVATAVDGDRLAQLQQEAGALPLTARQNIMMRLPILLAYPTVLFPKPQSWDQYGYSVTSCGSFRGNDDISRPVFDSHTLALKTFLEGGGGDDAPPVFISWGPIMGVRDDMVRLVIKALLLSNKRGVMERGGGWGNTFVSQLNPVEDADLITYAKARVFELETATVPPRWLLSQCCVIVHHGGCSTTTTFLYAGVPQVVLPVLADQPFWAVRVGVVGVGPLQPCSAYEVTPERLAAMILEVSTSEYLERARAIRNQVEKENGVDRAIVAIEREGGKGGEVFWGRIMEGLESDEKTRVRQSRVIVAGILMGLTAVVVVVGVRRRWRLSPRQR